MGFAMLSGAWALDAREFWLPLGHLALLAATVLVTAWLGGLGLGLDVLRADGHTTPAAAGCRAANYGGLGLLWFCLGTVILYAAFPVGLGVILAALRWPVTIMLLALLLRLAWAMAAFRCGTEPKIWQRYGVACTAVVVALGQGYALGVVMSGYRGGMAYAILAASIAVCVLAAYIMLAACRVIASTPDGLARAQAARWARYTAWVVAIGVAAGSVSVSLTNLTVLHRWLAPAALTYMVAVPLLTLLAFATLEFSLRRLDDGPGWRAVPQVMAGLIIGLVFVGVSYSLFPYLIPGKLTVWEAAASGAALALLAPGLVAAVVMLAMFTILVLRRAKAAA